MGDLLIKLALAGVVFFGVLNLAGLHAWVERKQSALLQDRIGATRAPLPRQGSCSGQISGMTAEAMSPVVKFSGMPTRRKSVNL